METGQANPSTSGTALQSSTTVAANVLTVRPELDLRQLPARLSDTTLAMVREIAIAPLPRLEPCDERHWAAAMERLAILPRRAEDTRTAEVRDHAMQSLLAHYGNQAIIHMASEVLRKHQWYPTPAQCIDILDAWCGHGAAGERKAKAQHLIRREAQARMDDTRKALQWGRLDASDICNLSDWEKKVFETEGLIRANPDGGHTPRPRFPCLEK